MVLSDINSLLSLIGAFGIGGAISAVFVIVLVKIFFPSYLSEKAKNLATKEDIELITEKVESVKLTHSQMLEEFRSQNQIMINAIEREKTIKKEVYLDAGESLLRLVGYIPGLLDLNLSQDKFIEGLSMISGKIAKIQIVGGGETVRAVTAINSEFTVIMLDLIKDRLKLVARQEEINALMGTSPNEIDGLFELQNMEYIAFCKKCMNSYCKISTLVPDAILSMRKELDLEISSEDYINIYMDDIETAREAFMKFIENIENETY